MPAPTAPTAPVVVMGVSGSGKSTVGTALAQRLGVPFVDADTLHPATNIAKMAAGEPLDDDDRCPWLDRIGEWLAAHRDGGVVSCSALKRTYRDQLRARCPAVEFLHLSGSPELIGSRQDRPFHAGRAAAVPIRCVGTTRRRRGGCHRGCRIRRPRGHRRLSNGAGSQPQGRLRRPALTCSPTRSRAVSAR